MTEKDEMLDNYDFQKSFVKHYYEEVKQFELFTRENVSDFHSPSGHAHFAKHYVWHAIEKGYEDAKNNWRRERKKLAEMELELRKDGAIPGVIVEHEIPLILTREEISKYAQWKYLIWDYASEEHLKEEIEWAEERNWNYTIDKIQDWWSRETQVLFWNDDAPEIFKSIKARVVYDNGYYPSMYLFTEGGDHFLSVEYHSKEGCDNKGYLYNEDKQIYTVVDDFYKDIFTYLVGLRAMRILK